MPVQHENTRHDRKQIKFEKCKKEIFLYNHCIRSIVTNDPLNKCDVKMIDIQECIKKIENKL